MGLAQVALARRDFKELRNGSGQAIDQTEESARTARGHRLYFFGLTSAIKFTRARLMGKIKALMAQARPDEAFVCSDCLKPGSGGDMPSEDAPDGTRLAAGLAKKNGAGSTNWETEDGEESTLRGGRRPRPRPSKKRSRARAKGSGPSSPSCGGVYPAYAALRYPRPSGP